DALEPVTLDLGHEVRTHALLAHPVEKLVVRIVAAQPDLHEVASGNVLVFDEAPYGGAVGDAVAHVRLAAVCVGVEVHHAHSACSIDVGTGGGVGPEDRVITSQHDGNGTRLGDLAHQLADGRHRGLDAEGVHRGVSIVDDGQDFKRLHAHMEVVHQRRRCGQVALCGAYGARPPRGSPMTATAVHRRSQDRNLGPGRPQVLLGEADRHLHEGGDAREGRLQVVAAEIY